MRGALFVARVLAVGIAACGDSRPLGAGDAIRLIADPGIRREGRFLSWGTMTTIGGVARPVLSTVQPVETPTEVLPQPNGGRKLRAQIPPDFAGLPWLVFETTVTRGDVTTMMRSWPVTGGRAGTSYEVWVTESKAGPHDRTGIRLWPVPDLASRDVETGDVVVPADAALKLGVGLEPSTWHTTVVPVAMKVTATSGAPETVLWTTELDPRRPEHQRWLDVSIPLDALAGQTVRFRFSARPKLGPTAAVSLPVWADPTIVVAPRATTP